MRYATFLTFLCLVLTIQFLPAQAPDTLWTKTFGGPFTELGNDVKQTTEEGYIISAGRAAGLWLIKTNAIGDTIWTKQYGNPNSNGVGFCVQQTSDGGYIITGSKSKISANSIDVWLVKTDSDGDTIWTKTYGGTDWYEGHFVQQTSDGGYFIAGLRTIRDTDTTDVLMIKTDSNGDTLWTKSYGGLTWERCYSGCQTTDEGFIVVGYTYSFGAGGTDVWLVKTDSNGDTLWTKTYGGIYNDIGYSVQQTSDGGYIITGSTSSYGAGYDDVWLIKTDSDGDTLWTRTFGGSLSDGGTVVQNTFDGGYIIMGYTVSFGSGDGDVWLIKTDSNGDTLWTKCIWGGGIIYGEPTTDKGYIMVGTTDYFGAGVEDVWLVRIAPDTGTVSIRNNNTGYPVQYTLSQNYPNPFNPTTIIGFDLPKTSEVTLKIFNILGDEVVTLVSDRLSAGSYSYEWDASGLASGVYLYRLEAGNYVETKKMMLLK